MINKKKKKKIKYHIYFIKKQNNAYINKLKYILCLLSKGESIK